jgi:hypothetical protein
MGYDVACHNGASSLIHLGSVVTVKYASGNLRNLRDFVQSWYGQLILYAQNIPSAVCEAPPENEKIMLEICRGP